MIDSQHLLHALIRQQPGLHFAGDLIPVQGLRIQFLIIQPLRLLQLLHQLVLADHLEPGDALLIEAVDGSGDVRLLRVLQLVHVVVLS